MKQVTRVYLREKAISKNRQTLYLDFYPPIKNPDNGDLTRREFLRLTLFNEFLHKDEEYLDKNGKLCTRRVKVLGKDGKPKKATLTEHQKSFNQNTRRLAETIQAQRQISLQDESYGFLSDKRRNTDFIEFFDKMADDREGSNKTTWKSALAQLKAFAGETLKMSELTEDKYDEFKSYLQKKANLSQNSAFLYLSKVRAAMTEAHKKKLLVEDMTKTTKGIAVKEVKKDYLTEEEIQTAIDKPCSDPQLKVVALVSTFTGLRFSDIQKLKWSEVKHSKGEGHTIQFTQQKTDGVEYLQIPPEVSEFLGDRGNPDEKVFPGLIYNNATTTTLNGWMNDCEINKRITFHCFRHTFAVLQLLRGTDLYTLSKMMGHKDIKTTQVYAKIVDKTKRVAADRIVGKFDFSKLKNSK